MPEPTTPSSAAVARRAPGAAEAARALRDTDRARRSLANLATSMEEVVDALRTAHDRSAHHALGYDSWEDYCAQEFAAVRATRIAMPDRIEIVAALTAVGMSPPEVGSALGVSRKTVERDVERGQADGGRALPPQGRGARYRDTGATAGQAIRATPTTGPTVRGTVVAEQAPRRPTMPWPGQHFAMHHDLHDAATRRCRERGHQNTSAYGACGPCWEATIRADERTAR